MDFMAFFFSKAAVTGSGPPKTTASDERWRWVPVTLGFCITWDAKATYPLQVVRSVMQQRPADGIFEQLGGSVSNVLVTGKSNNCLEFTSLMSALWGIPMSHVLLSYFGRAMDCPLSTEACWVFGGETNRPSTQAITSKNHSRQVSRIMKWSIAATCNESDVGKFVQLRNPAADDANSSTSDGLLLYLWVFIVSPAVFWNSILRFPTKHWQMWQVVVTGAHADHRKLIHIRNCSELVQNSDVGCGSYTFVFVEMTSGHVEWPIWGIPSQVRSRIWASKWVTSKRVGILQLCGCTLWLPV